MLHKHKLHRLHNEIKRLRVGFTRALHAVTFDQVAREHV